MEQSSGRYTPLPPIATPPLSVDQKPAENDVTKSEDEPKVPAKRVIPKLPDLSGVLIDDLFTELESKTSQLKLVSDFSLAVSQELNYLQSASRYGKNLEVC